MAIPKTLSTDPYAILHPDDRWRPGPAELHGMPIGNLLPPLVDKVRRAVHAWRDLGYPQVSDTSRALLNWWFCRSADNAGLRYYFAQREAVESIIYLHEHQTGRMLNKYDLLRFSSGGVTPEMMPEDWRRLVIKMATGSGKTKVMSLLILWSYFHKTYETGSDLSRNVLLIAPNLIVLDRLCRDFAGLRIFYDDGALPENGYAGCDWQNDFRMRMHKQDDVRGAQSLGNLYITNIHRVNENNVALPSAGDENTENYFLGARAADIKKSPAGLAGIVRSADELLVINDEAHHIHDPCMEWFCSIQDIHNSMVQKGRALSLQVDLTATPKHNNGSIFPQTIADYPLVEAIYQNIVKRPVVPDDESAAKLREHQHPKYAEQHADYIKLGVEEWRKAREQHKKAGKKAVLFVMTDDTRNCDELAEYLQRIYSDLEGKVLVIHTKKNGEIDKKATGKKEKELQQLRKDAAEIDNADNPYSAVVSVLVLREGWDVKNVTTIVGLRAYAAQSKILPEQTLGRGLRLMYDGGGGEKVSVIGTAAFAEFVRQIEQEGVTLEKVQMNTETDAQTPLIIAIDRDNPQKDIVALDIKVPVLSRRFNNDFSKVVGLRAENIPVQPAEYKKYDKDAPREIVFCDVVSGKVSHTTALGDGLAADYSNVIGYFARCLMKQFKIPGGYNYFYELVELFVRERLFGKAVSLDADDTLRNLAETPITKKLLDALGAAIGNIIRTKAGEVTVQGRIRVSDMNPFTAKQQKFVEPRKSAQNYIIGDSGLELEFARFLDSYADVAAFAKIYYAVGFCMEYVKTDGTLSRYFPDFLVRDTAGKLWVVETKGRKDEDDVRKLNRLAAWQQDVCALAGDAAVGCLLVDEFKKQPINSFADLAEMFPLTGEGV